MAFGKFIMVSSKAKTRKPEEKKKIPEVKKTPVTFDKGASVIEILLIAPTCEEAEDFLCGSYFNLIQVVGGSGLTVYTREFSTITKLTETKQLMEEVILKPVGKEIVRATPKDEVPLEQCTITLAQAGNTALSVDLHFVWATPSTAVGHQADVVFALLNYAESQVSQACVNAARQAATNYPLIWIISNFENKQLFWSVDGNTAPKAQLRKELRELLNLTCNANEYISYMQFYGGLEFLGRSGGNVLLRSDRRCREYMPVGCHVPAFVAIDAVRRFRSNVEGAVIPDVALEKLWLLMQVHNDTIKGWYDCHVEKGWGGK